MKNEEILKQAIEKAKDNGFTKVSNFVLNTQDWERPISDGRFMSIIFSHEFAKAFWGEEYICPDCGKKEECYCTNLDLYMFPRKEKAWQYHLQIMVLEEDPIQYLANFK